MYRALASAYAAAAGLTAAQPLGFTFPEAAAWALALAMFAAVATDGPRKVPA